MHGYQKPHEVLQALDITEGELIADIGAGSGYFALRLAHHVGADGHVYAVDVNPDMPRHLTERIRDAGPLNVALHFEVGFPNGPIGYAMVLVSADLRGKVCEG